MNFCAGTSCLGRSLLYSFHFLPVNEAMLSQQYHEELRALRNLERAVRAYSLSASLVSDRQRSHMLAVALKEVVEARKASIRKSKLSSA